MLRNFLFILLSLYSSIRFSSPTEAKSDGDQALNGSQFLIIKEVHTVFEYLIWLQTRVKMPPSTILENHFLFICTRLNVLGCPSYHRINVTPSPPPLALFLSRIPTRLALDNRLEGCRLLGMQEWSVITPRSQKGKEW